MMRLIINIFKSAFKWIFSHKKITFIYFPAILIFLISIYVLLIFLSWQDDREKALDRLAKYKQLIDRTEDIRKGYVYSYNDIDLSAKVVDIPTRIYDRNKEVIGEFFEEKREIVPYDYIPQWIVKGVIASEDRNFYKHKGVDYKGIIRALFSNILNFRIVQGGSTITQQLAKVLFTDMERSFKRKIYEAFCAQEIEKHYDKQDILSMYLNLIYFGNGSYGVESTSKMFFGRSVKRLNEVECAMIVATISSPRSYSPISNLKNSLRKTKRILKSLVDAGYVKKERADYQYKRFIEKWDVNHDKKNKTITSLIGSFVYSSFKVNRAPFFNERIRRILVKRFGEEVLKKGGLSIYTTIDASKQDIALGSLRKGISKQRKYHIDKSKKIKNAGRRKKEITKAKNIEGALITLNPFTGQIISYVGGSELSSENQNDNVSQIRRQPGSSIKPVIYLAAIENKDITPSTVLIDEKTEFKGGYSPGNYGNTYSGDIIVREALRKSVNIIAVKILNKTGYSRIFEIIQKSLFLTDDQLKSRFGKTLSLALGTYEISPMENCVLHSIIVNGGDYIYPYGILNIKDYNGNIVWNNEEEIQQLIEERRGNTGKIIDPISRAIIISMLKGVFEEGGTAYWSGKKWNIDFPVAGKTGTSSNYNDGWFVGYTSDLVTAVWIGNKKGSISLGKGRAGGVISAPVWTEYISKIYTEEHPDDFVVPDKGISKEKICIETGKVAAEHCPDVRFQLYYSGTEPGEYCPIHKSIVQEK